MRDVVATTADAHRKCIQASELGGVRRASLQDRSSCGGVVARATKAQALRDDTQAVGGNRRVSA